MNFIIKLFVSGLAVMLSAYLLPGVHVESFFWQAIFVAAFLGLLNVTIKPLFVLLTIPITFFTLGLFLLVINALMIMLTDYVIPGFSVDNFWWALAFSLILAIINSLFEDILKSGERRRAH